MKADADLELENLEIALLLNGIQSRYGYDFTNYAPASMKRRIVKSLEDEKLDSISVYQAYILRDQAVFERFLINISISVTSMFRDPDFFLALRNVVVPELRRLSHIRIWVAGCSSGEEVLSLAILLKEENLYDTCRIYATDLSADMINKAQNGIYTLRDMRQYSENYFRAGGKRSFSDYYHAKFNEAIFDRDLRSRIVYAVHNLVTDASFNEFHLILCRNVMIYFNRILQNQVHDLLYDSLAADGFLALGTKETIKFTSHETDYTEIDGRNKIYRIKPRMDTNKTTNEHEYVLWLE